MARSSGDRRDHRRRYGNREGSRGEGPDVVAGQRGARQVLSPGSDCGRVFGGGGKVGSWSERRCRAGCDIVDSSGYGSPACRRFQREGCCVDRGRGHCHTEGRTEGLVDGYGRGPIDRHGGDDRWRSWGRSCSEAPHVIAGQRYAREVLGSGGDCGGIDSVGRQISLPV